jgi:hypothetical protein
MSALHILFSPSAAVDLRGALAMAGRDDQVVRLMDDLSFGPIDPPDLQARARWIEEALGWDDWETLAPELDAFWLASLDDHPRRIVWFSRRDTMEFCGFLEWLRRNGERPFEAIDLTDAVFPRDGDSGPLTPAPITGLIPARQFAGARLWDLANPPSAVALAGWFVEGDRLRRENAALRVLTPDGLTSAPLNYFDQQMLRHVGDDWRPAALAVGRFLGETYFESFAPGGIRQTGDLVPIARIAALAAAGKIEARGNPYEVQTCTIRRPR